MKVEELEMYGKALEMPKEAVRKQSKIVFRLLRKEFGFWGIPGLIIGMQKHNKQYRISNIQLLKIGIGIEIGIEIERLDATTDSKLFIFSISISISIWMIPKDNGHQLLFC